VAEIILIEDVHFDYGVSGFELTIPSFTLSAGERVLLLGPSGIGKSTFLNLITGVLQPRRGRICLLEQELTKLTAAQSDQCRGDHVGLIYQTLNLVPWLTARENVALGVAFSKRRQQRLHGSVDEATKHLMDRLGLSYDAYGEARAERLSIGQQQRIGAARALIGAPELIIADEPTSALDRPNAIKFLDLVFSSMDHNVQGFLMVSHDDRLADGFSRVIQFEDLMTMGARS